MIVHRIVASDACLLAHTGRAMHAAGTEDALVATDRRGLMTVAHVVRMTQRRKTGVIANGRGTMPCSTGAYGMEHLGGY